MGFVTMNREEFIEMRWRVYKNSVENKEQIAREHDVPVECISFGEPPHNDEVICDICNAEVETETVILDEAQSYLYCEDCANEVEK